MADVIQFDPYLKERRLVSEADAKTKAERAALARDSAKQKASKLIGEAIELFIGVEFVPQRFEVTYGENGYRWQVFGMDVSGQPPAPPPTPEPPPEPAA